MPSARRAARRGGRRDPDAEGVEGLAAVVVGAHARRQVHPHERGRRGCRRAALPRLSPCRAVAVPRCLSAMMRPFPPGRAGLPRGTESHTETRAEIIGAPRGDPDSARRGLADGAADLVRARVGGLLVRVRSVMNCRTLSTRSCKEQAGGPDQSEGHGCNEHNMFFAGLKTAAVVMNGNTAIGGRYLRRCCVLNGVDDCQADHRAISTVLSQVEDMLILRDTETDSASRGMELRVYFWHIVKMVPASFTSQEEE